MMSDKDRKIIEETEGTDEPIIVFRAKDVYSIFPIAAYWDVVRKSGNCDPEFLEALDIRVNEFRNWQADNAERVDVPD